MTVPRGRLRTCAAISSAVGRSARTSPRATSVFVSPADAAVAKLSQNGPVSPATRAAIEAQLGVPTGSWWHQYVEYLNTVVHLRFGVSYTFFPQKVSGMVAQALPWTLVMVGLVTVLAFVVGSLIGVAAAWRRGAASEDGWFLIPHGEILCQVPE